MTDHSDLCARLRGKYRIPITDGLGPAGGAEPDNEREFVRHFPTPPIQNAAADAIQALVRERDEARAYAVTLQGALSNADAWFREYADHHSAKGDLEKARRNLERADACAAAIRALKERGE